MLCRQCGTANNEGVSHCLTCGAPLASPNGYPVGNQQPVAQRQPVAQQAAQPYGNTNGSNFGGRPRCWWRIWLASKLSSPFVFAASGGLCFCGMA